ncbi:MAG: VCBS repeat-containing protein [Acidobacteriota bacterium]
MTRTFPRMLVILLGAAAAQAFPTLPPTPYSTPAGASDVHALTLGSAPSQTSMSITIQNVGVELWERQGDGTFVLRQTISVPGAYAHVPVRLSSPSFDDVFIASLSGNTITFGLYEFSGTYGLVSTGSYNANIAPPQGTIIVSSPGFNANTGGDVAMLVEPNIVGLFGDDGAGNLNMTPTLVNLGVGVQGDLLAEGDTNTDALEDLYVGESGPGRCRILENTGFNFSLRQTLTIAGLRHMTTADLNGDGFDDIAVLLPNLGRLEIAIHTGNPNVPYGVPTSYPTGIDPRVAVFQDVNPPDGRPEVMVLCQTPGSDGSLEEFLNDGAGNLTGNAQYYVATGQINALAAVDGTFLAMTDPSGVLTAYTMALDGNLSSATSIVCGPGPGATNPAEVRVYTGGATPVVPADFIPYPVPAYGTNVAAGNVDGVTAARVVDELLTGPGPGPVYGPQVRGFNRSGTVLAKLNYYAYGTLKYGVNVDAGLLDTDAIDEILTGAGPGSVFGPHVRGWNYDGVAISAISKVSYFAYGTLKYGVNIALGDIQNPGLDEILTAPGPGSTFTPQMRGFAYDGVAITAISKVNFNAFPQPGYGGRVTTSDVEGDAYDEIVCTHGPGPSHPAVVAGWDFDGTAVSVKPGYNLTVYPTFYGASIAGGYATGAGAAAGFGIGDVQVGAGPDPAAPATVSTVVYGGGAASIATNTFDPFPATFYGVRVGAAALAF